MPGYKIVYGDLTCEISGYLLVQPISFNARGVLEVRPDNMRLLVQMHLVRSSKREHSAYSTQLPISGDPQIHDGGGNLVISLEGTSTRAVFSTQSRDLSSTVWAFGGHDDSNLQFTPPEYPKDGLGGEAKHYPWSGSFDGGDGYRLDISYVDCVYQIGPSRSLAQLLVMGPANSDRSGSAFNFVTSGAGQVLPAAKLVDDARGTEIALFGDGTEGPLQMREAKGAVFALNGTFKRVKPGDLTQLINEMTAGSVLQRAKWREYECFKQIAQSILETTEHSESKQDAFRITEADFEGLMLTDLNPRGNVDVATLL